MLPRDSATVARELPEAAWGWQEHLLASIDYTLKVIACGIGAAKGRPERIRPPKGAPGLTASQADMLAVARELGIDDTLTDLAEGGASDG